jgi:hypothetical protein
MFQARETDLEGRVAELEDEVEERKEKGEEDAGVWAARCDEMAAEAVVTAKTLAAAEKAKKKLDVRLSVFPVLSTSWLY